MRLRADQLPAHLRRGLAPIYLVSGDEPLLRQEACDAIRAAAREAGFTERLVMDVDAAFDWQTLGEAAENLSLFAERRLIEMRFGSARVGDGSTALQRYAESPPADTLLLLVFPRIDAQVQRTRWYRAVEAAGAAVAVWPPDAGQFQAWVAERLRQRGLRADRSAIDLLAERSEGNLLACVQEIEKIRLLLEQEEIGAEDVLRAVADSARFDVFDLVDRALAGDAARSLRALQGLLTEGIEPPLITWALTRAIRSHAGFAAAIADGQPLDTVLRADRVWARRRGLVEQALRRHDRMAWWALTRLAGRVDRVAKGQAAGNAGDELLQLTMILAGALPVTKIREEESEYR